MLQIVLHRSEPPGGFVIARSRAARQARAELAINLRPPKRSTSAFHPR
jgi:hypothetical protein